MMLTLVRPSETIMTWGGVGGGGGGVGKPLTFVDLSLYF